MKKIFFYDTSFGLMAIAEDNGGISDIYTTELRETNGAAEEETPLIRQAAEELREYLNGKRKLFRFPLAPAGTPFQQKVWKALINIPYGEIRTYKDIAIQVDSPKGFRAVGMANNKNPIMIAIPCHRVVGSDGSLTGYAGGLDMKERLIRLEEQHK